MKSQIYIVLVIIFISKASCMDSFIMKKQNDNIIHYYRNGQISITLKGSQAAGLLEHIIDRLRHCDDSLDLLVSLDLIDNLKLNEECLEVQLLETKEFETLGTRKIQACKLLIPITGKFAQNDQITFFWGQSNWASGPFLKYKGLKDIRKLLEISIQDSKNQ